CVQARLNDPGKGKPVRGSSPDEHLSSAHLQIVRCCFELHRGGGDQFVSYVLSRGSDGVPRKDDTAAGEGPDAEVNLMRLAPDHRDIIEVDAETVGGDLGKRRLMALALRAGAGGHHDLTGRIYPYRCPLVGADACSLDVCCDADTPVDTPHAQRLLFAAERGVLDLFEHLRERAREVTRIVDEGVPIAVEK